MAIMILIRKVVKHSDSKGRDFGDQKLFRILTKINPASYQATILIAELD